MKVIHAPQLLGRVVDRDPLHDRGKSFVTPDLAQNFPRQEFRLVAGNFQQRVGSVTRVRIREAYFKVVEEAFQRNEAMKARYEQEWG